MRNLILTGGIRHDFDDNTASVVELLSQIGIQSETTIDIESGVARLAEGSFDLLTVMALRWSMEGDPKYAPHREQWAFSISSAARKAIHDFVAGGGGLFGLHTACLCFDDWADWRNLLGGVWLWGRSFHPPLGPILVSRTVERHSLTAGLPSFDLIDEVYSGLSIADNVTPLLTAKAASQGDDEPVLWARQFGHGRVAFDGLGHDRASLTDRVHSRIVQRCAAWAGGMPAKTIESI